MEQTRERGPRRSDREGPTADWLSPAEAPPRARAELPRLSGKERIILDLLTERGEQYGLQLVAAAGGRLKRGTVYVTLARMEEKRLISSRLETPADKRPGIPRRLYTPTADGLRTLRALQAAEAVLLAPEFQT